MKKNSVMRRLFYNNPCVIEEIRMSKEYSDFLDVADKLEIELRSKLKGNDEMVELLGKFITADANVGSEEAFCFFKEGLKFGVLLGMELAQE